jgi:hypothetical protein
MRDLLLLAIDLLVTLAKFLRPGGVRGVAAESQKWPRLFEQLSPIYKWTPGGL